MIIELGDKFMNVLMNKTYEVKEISIVKRNNIDTEVYHLIEISPVYGQTSYFTSKDMILSQFKKLN